ncbi:calcitonin gene-related peptide type 1 receptor [Drosophila guanche]|uniref:Blast:Calcitonin gene-related peptide type 1 receptor n=1 Tax=Drosophila guanche TaxID=7266 RepID=A0A3B0KVK5_DROGU|nr:calcitonin gene-related peptide type 1 receptor [Drosophila guanche]XP_034139860.1 calcitonin gene-related peptide type 1 receptor [Drosophila guanche]XP_034139861.1 calcitonin gene-related peptide type 1 receptor [Drosophila guanche]SPP89391.1 blast:Calcitonin gene-related peptide type 1 receptor [Drosophila guanche]
MTTVSQLEAAAASPAATAGQHLPEPQQQPQPQSQDNLRVFLKHLYAECVYRYQNDTFEDGDEDPAGLATDYEVEVPQNFSPVPRYLENAVLNEGSIDMQSVNEASAANNELYATILTATMSAHLEEEQQQGQQEQKLANLSRASGSSLFCPLNFDGYLCWPRTPAGTVLSQYCPDFVEGFNSKFLAHKTCLENGTWFRHPVSNLTWSNYTNCVDYEDLEFRQFINELYVNGYALSLLALLISIIIFLGFKSLRCTRIRIHVHLFASLACTCVSWILWYRLVVERPELIAESPLWCIGLHLVVHYFMLVNYFWMFCEGLHLHLVLVVVFVKDTIVMRWFKIISWLCPLHVALLYGTARHYSSTDNEHCWINDSLFLWIFSVPITLSLLASFIFLINVLRVIVRKLHPQSAQPAPLAIRKAVRATIILVPLFGLQHFLLPYRPDAGTQLDRFYQLLSVVLVSLQGFVVSFLFCFANHDVTFAMRTLLNKWVPTLVAAPPAGSNTGQLATTTPSRELGV